MTDKNEGWTWCCHHMLELEYCTDFRGRVQYIQTEKPESEHTIRLREFRFVLHPERLPVEVVEAQKARERAIALSRARGAWYGPDHIMLLNNAYKAGLALEMALTRHQMAINALHREEFPETSWNGYSIFPHE